MADLRRNRKDGRPILTGSVVRRGDAVSGQGRKKGGETGCRLTAVAHHLDFRGRRGGVGDVRMVIDHLQPDGDPQDEHDQLPHFPRHGRIIHVDVRNINRPTRSIACLACENPVHPGYSGIKRTFGSTRANLAVSPDTLYLILHHVMIRGLPSIFDGFVKRRRDFLPAYRRLSLAELRERAERAREMLAFCRVCPRACGVNRLKDERGLCLSGRWADVASAFPHFGEEDVLRGWRGSGTIFFAFCNLKCVFCQNFEISRRGLGARPVQAEELAALMLALQEAGCHNINLVTPEHVVPQVLEALVIAVERGLNLPIVYNTSAYDSLESLRLLDGIVDIYMPDFKFWSPERAKRYLRAEDYPEVARRAIREMHRQVGDLVVDEEGLALRGVLIRHLVMPGYLDETRAILRWIRETLGPDVYVNLMDQYHPAGLVGKDRYPELNRRLMAREFQEAREEARRLGLWRLDVRWRWVEPGEP